MLYLASASPRRRELLRQIGVEFSCLAPDIDETPAPAEPAERYVERLAREKARAGLALCGRPGAWVLGADTAVVLDGAILGKPRDGADAQAMLMRLADRRHQVMTAVALSNGEHTYSRVVISDVLFAPIDAASAAAYWSSGEPADKAGGYGIQGLGAVFVRELQGSYSAVVGLPLFETAQLLALAGVPIWRR